MNKFLKWHRCRMHVSYLLVGMLCLALLPSFKANAVLADHGDFELTEGIYRIPYSDGTEMTVSHDHHSHGGPNGNKNRYDLEAGTGSEIVAAASGWIRGSSTTTATVPVPVTGWT